MYIEYKGGGHVFDQFGNQRISMSAGLHGTARIGRVIGMRAL